MAVFVPHGYQRYAIERLITEPNIGLYMDMGLGKTVCVLTAIQDLRLARFAVSKPLIIAPKKVAEATWTRERDKWDHLRRLRLSIVLGTERQRIKALCTPADAYIINRDNVAWLVKYYQHSWPFDMVVVDESSSFKNHDAHRFKALKWIRPHIRRMVLLSGTPTPHGLMDLWSQIYLLDQGQRLYDHIGKFRTRYFDQRYEWGYTAKAGAEREIFNRIKDICISMDAKDYLQLPDLIIDDIPVALSPKAQAAYNELERKAILEMGDMRIDAGSAAVLSQKLLQLCNGAVYDKDHRVMEVHNDKIEAFMETLERLNGKPCIVYYHFQHDLQRLWKALQSTGLRVRLLQGAADEDAWNRREVDVLLSQPASNAYGLNLQDGGNHVIWFGMNWNLELYQQAIKRIHRQGQTQKVIVHRLLVVGGLDEDVADSLEDKAGVQERFLKAIKARVERVKAL